MAQFSTLAEAKNLPHYVRNLRNVLHDTDGSMYAKYLGHDIALIRSVAQNEWVSQAFIAGPLDLLEG